MLTWVEDSYTYFAMLERMTEALEVIPKQEINILYRAKSESIFPRRHQVRLVSRDSPEIVNHQYQKGKLTQPRQVA